MKDIEAQDGRDPAGGVTRQLVEQALDLRFSGLPREVRGVARDCLTDWLGCSFLGLDETVCQIVREAAQEEGGHPQATMLGQAWRGSVLQAALVNGTLSHALDYDDVNLTVPGHMSAAIIPALLAVSEQRGASGADFTAAFVAGYEFACRVGTLVEPAHYANGFHATATVGSLGAAMACAHLLRLSTFQASHAIGLAATQAAGLKAMFGSMAKPLHAGLASQSGLRSALLAQKGLISRPDVLECVQGFAQVHGSDFHAQAATSQSGSDFHILNNLFKFHAACYSVHSTIEAAAALRQQFALGADSVREVRVVAGNDCSICNIQNPRTGLEAKFSLRASAAFALLDIDTSKLESWERVCEPLVASVLERVNVELVQGMGLSDSLVTVICRDGTEHTLAHDCGQPISDKAFQSRRVNTKFCAIAEAALGHQRMAQMLQVLESFEHEPDVTRLLELCRLPPG